MADNVTVDNADLTDFAVRSTEKSSKQVQHMIVDLGGDGAESLLASDNPLPTAGEKSSTANTQSTVSVGTSSTEILAANATRKGAYIYNLGSATVYFGYGVTATTAMFPLVAGASLNLKIGDVLWTGSLNGIVSSGSEDIRVIEV